MKEEILTAKTMMLKDWLKWLKVDFKSASAWYYKRIPKYTKENITEAFKGFKNGK